MDIFEDTLYIVTEHSNSIYKMDKFGGKLQNITHFYNDRMKITNLLIVQENKQNIRCKHLLILIIVCSITKYNYSRLFFSPYLLFQLLVTFLKRLKFEKKSLIYDELQLKHKLQI